jgi:hypothetical protein
MRRMIVAVVLTLALVAVLASPLVARSFVDGL